MSMDKGQIYLSIQSSINAFQEGRFEQAIELLESVLKEEPRNFEALNFAGIVAIKTLDYGKAAGYLLRALKIRPDDITCAQNLTFSALMINDLDLAHYGADTALASNPHDKKAVGLMEAVVVRQKLAGMPMQIVSLIDLSGSTPQLRVRDGDHWFSLGLKQALVERGVQIVESSPKIYFLLHGGMPKDIPDDCYRMIWLHSHPENLRFDFLSKFHQVFSLSPSYTKLLAGKGFLAETLIGGTNHTKQDAAEIRHGIVFVGNARNALSNPRSRPIIRDIVSLGEKWTSKLEVWGIGWRGLIPDKCIEGDGYNNRELAKLYASSVVVINDHHDDMRRQGFLNPRILDVMASGGLILSDNLAHAEDVFEESLLVYRSPQELDSLLEKCFNDPEFRLEWIKKGQSIVEKYSFEKVAEKIVAHLLRLNPKDLGNQNQRVLAQEGNEAWISYKDDKVIKRFKPQYHDYNRQYNRRGEPYYINKYNSPYFIKCHSWDENGIVMENGGRPIGVYDDSTERKRRLEPDGLNLLKLVAWLRQLKLELDRLGLKHRDINPTNILYKPQTDSYCLIDFGWMLEKGDLDTPDTRPPGLNAYAPNDEEAINRLSIEVIQSLILKINSEVHHDGSSTRTGWVYHPIPFPEIQAQTHKQAAHKELEEILELAKIPVKNAGRKVLEIGCSVGYFTFNLAQRGCEVVAFEADKEVYETAEAMRLWKGFDNIRFIGTHFDTGQLDALDDYFDLCLMMNVHMWIYKNLGPEHTRELMRKLARKTHRLLFQTAHAQSGGMYQVQELETSADVKEYLENCGYSNVKHIRDTGAHGGIRSLFLCEGKKD